MHPTYAAMQIPGGWLVDRVPPRILYSVALLLVGQVERIKL
ncbi:hypothetical protein ACOI9X_01090 [Pseudomonas sp. P2757]